MSLSDIEIFNLRCEYTENALAMDTRRPRFSWQLKSDRRGQTQKAYQILVATSQDLLQEDKADLWDTGRVQANRQHLVEYNGVALQSRMQCYWMVRVWDKDETVSGWSKPSCFETGLFDLKDWQGQWIGLNESFQPTEAAPYLRKSFELSGDIVSARAYVAGLGYYELEINGCRVGDHVLDPGQTDYEQRTFYVAYDVTKQLKRGGNALGVILGDGWYHQTRVWKKDQPVHGIDAIYGQPRLLLQVMVTLADGSEVVIASDSSWQCNTGPILANNVYAGEVYDARLELGDWSTADYDATDWRPVALMDGPGGRLVAQMLPAIKCMEVVKPRSVKQPKQGVWVIDMGQHFAGVVRLKIEAPAGTTIKLRCTEDLDTQGMVDMTSTGIFATLVEPTLEYTCKGGGQEIWQPKFTYFGFRYVEMTGWPGNSGEPTVEMLEGVVIHTSVKTAGRFECSDAMLNRIHTAALWTERSNMHSIPTDCPAREKCGWLGDAHVTAEMTMYNYDVAQFWTKYIRDMETTRRGDIPWNIAPGRRLCPPKDPDWAVALVLIPWYVYLHYGDRRVLEEHYDSLLFMMNHFDNLAEDYIINAGLGDWCSPSAIRPKQTPPALTTTAYYYVSAQIMSKVEKILDKGDGRRWEELAGQIRGALITRFYDTERKTFGSQTSDAIALRYGLMPEGDRLSIAESLARNVMKQHGGHFSTGIMGSLWLYWALSEYGYGDVTMTILHKEDYPSIGFIFRHGATSFWEMWGEEYHGVEGFRPRSRSHPMQCGFDAWFYHGIAGICPDDERPGYEHFVLHPQILPGLDHAGAEYQSPCGQIKSQWKKTDQGLEYDVLVPVNSSATVHLPVNQCDSVTVDGQDLAYVEGLDLVGEINNRRVVEAGAGSYRFIICRK